MSGIRIHDVPVDMVSDLWPLVSPLLEPACARNPHLSMADLLLLVMGQFGQLIVAIEGVDIVAAAVMQRDRYPKHVIGNILMLGGRPGTMGARLDAIYEHLTRWAKARGCDRIAFTGLPGLTRVVKRHGGQSIRLIHAWRDL